MPTSQTDEAALANEAGDPSTASTKKPGRDPALLARDEMMARADAHIEAERAAEHKRFLESSDVDPRAALLASEMAREARGEPTAADRERSGDEPETVDGAASVQPADAAEKQAREAVRISNKGEDPLGDYVVRVEGKPMFKTLVDGKERLIPLEAARAQLQKHMAADIRLQQASEMKKQLDARETALRNNEATFQRRSHPSATAPVVDDRKLAAELVHSLVSEPEDKAVAKMAEVFGSIRQAQAPQIDAAALTQMAREEAQRTIADERKKDALGDGFTRFQKDYPDIAGDSDLFALADRKSEVIEAEHPDWAPQQIMDEAGKQTRAWMQSMGMTVKTATRETATRGNQQRKQNLVPMPQPRSAAPARQAEADNDGSPANALAEIRKLRGQPY
jgi:hypothetical protein